MQARMTARDKTSTPSTPFSFASLGPAVMESFAEGIALFDAHGRLLYANQRARRVIDALEGNGSHRGDGVRDKLIAFGGRVRALKQGSAELGEQATVPLIRMVEPRTQALTLSPERRVGTMLATLRTNFLLPDC